MVVFNALGLRNEDGSLTDIETKVNCRYPVPHDFKHPRGGLPPIDGQNSPVTPVLEPACFEHNKWYACRMGEKLQGCEKVDKSEPVCPPLKIDFPEKDYGLKTPSK